MWVTTPCFTQRYKKKQKKARTKRNISRERSSLAEIYIYTLQAHIQTYTAQGTTVPHSYFYNIYIKCFEFHTISRVWFCEFKLAISLTNLTFLSSLWCFGFFFYVFLLLQFGLFLVLCVLLAVCRCAIDYRLLQRVLLQSERIWYMCRSYDFLRSSSRYCAPQTRPIRNKRDDD